MRQCGLKVERDFAAGVAVYLAPVLGHEHVCSKPELKCVWVSRDMHITDFPLPSNIAPGPGTIHQPGSNQTGYCQDLRHVGNLDFTLAEHTLGWRHRGRLLEALQRLNVFRGSLTTCQKSCISFSATPVVAAFFRLTALAGHIIHTTISNEFHDSLRTLYASCSRHSPPSTFANESEAPEFEYLAIGVDTPQADAIMIDSPRPHTSLGLGRHEERLSSHSSLSASQSVS
ncbi:hypothetical protein CONLIGDRAFT_649859 [Coniochaeta ligniaria NRRL 30616]|uniref:Uncharacterized protein n=1 Tax=Coniochaeta ligniaria NRRL 30616 TaxID=1408157 RepID=A0A1J7J0E9_9PEZI|nr:hypothetical protein CONLIGDRAFT_649859 [Coniochaeta ligniaria NRRL 30616]